MLPVTVSFVATARGMANENINDHVATVPELCVQNVHKNFGTRVSYSLSDSLVWCERGDSNPHGFTRQILSLVRLPIPPLSHSM